MHLRSSPFTASYKLQKRGRRVGVGAKKETGMAASDLLPALGKARHQRE
jgi:hypothetical protein